jgi:uncharacterized protein (TIGR02246 family)
MESSKQNASEQPGAAPDEAAIRAMTSEYMAAVAAGDLRRFLAVFRDDVIVMPPDHPTARGRDAFTAFVKPFFDEFTLSETMSYDEIRVAGDWAVGTFTYTFTTTPKAAGVPSQELGKGIWLFGRSADGAWRITHAAWNRDEAALPA